MNSVLSFECLSIPIPHGLNGSGYRGFFSICAAFVEALEKGNQAAAENALRYLRDGLRADFNLPLTLQIKVEQNELFDEPRILARRVAMAVGGVDTEVQILKPPSPPKRTADIIPFPCAA